MAKKKFKAEKPDKDYLLIPQVEMEAKQEADDYGRQITQNKQNNTAGNPRPEKQSGKGPKLPRKNIALEPVNVDYLEQMSRLAGISISNYVNRMINADRISMEKELQTVK